MIWGEAANVPRFIEAMGKVERYKDNPHASRNHVNYPPVSLRTKISPSPLFRACVESRHEALKAYTLSFEGIFNPSRSLFNPSQDTVLLMGKNYSGTAIVNRGVDWRVHAGGSYPKKKDVTFLPCDLSSKSLSNIQNLAVTYYGLNNLGISANHLASFTSLRKLTVIAHETPCIDKYGLNGDIELVEIQNSDQLASVRLKLLDKVNKMISKFQDRHLALVPPEVHVKAMTRGGERCCLLGILLLRVKDLQVEDRCNTCFNSSKGEIYPRRRS